MLKRQLRYSVDSFAAFFRLGAQCWGPRIADPELEIKLASEDPVKKAERIRLEDEMCAKALKKKEQMAVYRRAKRAKYFALVQARREEKKKAAMTKQPKKVQKKAPEKTQPKKQAPAKRHPKKNLT